jgi:hypothetical protein
MRQQGYRFSLDTLPETEEPAATKPMMALSQANGSRLG